jgi:short-chain Z-isoprenyl diphosphate synthase
VLRSALYHAGCMRLRETATRPLYRFYENRLLATLDRARLPRHIGVIHDGHRRYARSERLPDYQASYRVGMQKFVEFLHWSAALEIPAVTCWLLSRRTSPAPMTSSFPTTRCSRSCSRRSRVP